VKIVRVDVIVQGYDDVHGETSFPWHTVEAAAPERTGWRILDKRLRARRECSAFSRHVSDNPVTGHEHVQGEGKGLLYCYILFILLVAMALSLSQLLAHDAPLLSPPLSPMPALAFDTDLPSPLHDFPPSPPQPSRALKARISPHDAQPDACAPTQQLFQLASPPPPSRQNHKRSASPAPAPAKKARAQVSSKDFVHPDVTGLNKREARLVKNRAAAFLSRQRKREEFENLEK